MKEGKHTFHKNAASYVHIRNPFQKGGDGMQSPFEVKNKAAVRIDRLALCILVCVLCIGYFLFLWESPGAGLLAGFALFSLLLLTFALFERSTLSRRDQLLRERIGGTIALTDLLLMPSGKACEQVCVLLCKALRAEQLDACIMRSEDEVFLVRCAQRLKGESISEGDVLAAHRARQEANADRCVLCSTGGVSPSAIRAAEWVDPPVRLISGAQLSALFGRMHPATDADIARHAHRQRQPFSLSRMRLVALSPAKQKKYLLCSFLLLLFYLITGSGMGLVSCLLALLLAILCKKENSRTFRL